MTARTLPALLAVMVGLLVLAGSGPARGDSGGQRDPQRDGIVVTVPVIGYGALADELRVGPYRTRLDVLANDAGLPDPRRLQLLDAGGSPVAQLHGRLGTLRVAAGYVLLTPAKRAAGRLTFRYRAASANGPVTDAEVRVRLYRRVIRAASDRAHARPGRQVTVDIAANDRIVVAGAFRACRPQLFTRPPRRPDPRPVVVPEPGHQPIVCLRGHRMARTAAGTWTLDARSRVLFTPAAGFTGTARAYYRQAVDYPFDLGVALVTVSVRRGGTGVLGTETGPRGSGDPLAATGLLAVLVLVGLLLAAVGSALAAAARRRRGQPADLAP